MIQFSRREILRLSKSTRRNHVHSRDWKTAMKPAMETAAMVDVTAPAYAWSKTPGNACTNRRHRIQTDQATRVSTPVDLHPSVAGFSGVCRWFVLFIGLVFFVTKPGSAQTDVTNLAGAVESDVVQGPKPMEVVDFAGIQKECRDSIRSLRDEILVARANQRAVRPQLMKELELWGGPRDHRRGVAIGTRRPGQAHHREKCSRSGKASESRVIS